MHYFIDGYNLLLRMEDAEVLRVTRERFIRKFAERIELRGWTVSLVFDAAFSLLGGSRSHINNLEVIFTDKGETADSYILDYLRRAKRPCQITVVTSDKALAKKARFYKAYTESVESFIKKMNTPKAKKAAISKTTSSNDSSNRGAFANNYKGREKDEQSTWYETIFEARLAELAKELPPHFFSSKKKVSFSFDSFEDIAAFECQKKWLHIFEKHLEDESSEEL